MSIAGATVRYVPAECMTPVVRKRCIASLWAELLLPLREALLLLLLLLLVLPPFARSSKKV